MPTFSDKGEKILKFKEIQLNVINISVVACTEDTHYGRSTAQYIVQGSEIEAASNQGSTIQRRRCGGRGRAGRV